jgi:hypothetical protein
VAESYHAVKKSRTTDNPIPQNKSGFTDGPRMIMKQKEINPIVHQKVLRNFFLNQFEQNNETSSRQSITLPPIKTIHILFSLSIMV